MIGCLVAFDDLRYLMETLGLEDFDVSYDFHGKNVSMSSWHAANFLTKANERVAKLMQERPDVVNADFNYERLQQVLAAFFFDRLDDYRLGLDYTAELRFRESIVSEDRFPWLYRYIVKIPGDTGFGLERENHRWGYHIHYVQLKGQRRTNTIFMFDPNTPEPVLMPPLYWEPHHEAAQVHVDPDDFGRRRRAAIYDTCAPFLSKVPIAEFKAPSKNSSLLYQPNKGNVFVHDYPRH